MELQDKQNLISLFGLYQPLLSEKISEYLDQYLISDLAVGEIAENAGVSKQAVSDQIGRGIKELERFEDLLHLRRDFQARRKLEQEILASAQDKTLINKLIEIEEQ